MKSLTSKDFAWSLLVLATTALGSSAFAASTWTIDMDATCASNATTQACSSSPAFTASGWSTGTGTTAYPTTGTMFAAATVYNYASGLGTVATNESSSTTGPHAIDNTKGIDALMLSFTSAPVNLSSLTIGWNGTDNPTGTKYIESDLSVLAWTGSGAPVMAGKALSTMLTSGWSLIGNYAGVGAQSGNTQTITSSTYSSYWLISAYSTAYGTGTGLDGGNDAFKVLAIAGSTYTCGSNCGGSKVPEPGSMALLGLGLLGVMASRRRG